MEIGGAMAVQEMIHQGQYTVDELEHFLRLPENRDRLFELIHREIVEKIPMEIYSPDKEMESAFGNDMVEGRDVLPGFTLSVQEIFADSSET